MTLYLSLGEGGVSITKTMEGDADAIRAQLNAALDRWLAMRAAIEALEEVPA